MKYILFTFENNQLKYLLGVYDEGNEVIPVYGPRIEEAKRFDYKFPAMGVQQYCEHRDDMLLDVLEIDE
jgi:hypothetical protein